MAKASAAAIALALTLLAPAHAVVPELGQPGWKALTLQQREVLAPLVSEWDRLDDARKRKWLGIAARYPEMMPEEQQRVQARMRQWASLTPEERRAARDRFRTLQALHPEAREALKRKWQEYSNLPDEEKKRLVESAGKRPPAKPSGGTLSLTTPSEQFRPSFQSVAPSTSGQASDTTAEPSPMPSDNPLRSAPVEPSGTAQAPASSSAPEQTQ